MNDKRKILILLKIAASTCTAAVHIFQILYARQFFHRFLSRAFTLCVHGRDNKIIIK